MNTQGKASYLRTALTLLTADVFFHPVWLHFWAMNPTEAARLTGELKREARRLAAEGDWLDACRVSLICASLHTLYGSAPAALESLRLAHQTASRHGLYEAAIWASWGAGAVCAQMNEYDPSAGYLQKLQQELYRCNEWVLADLIELVRQSLIERKESGLRVELRSPASEQDLTGQIIEQMMGWGKSPPGFSPEPGRPAFAASRGNGNGAWGLRPFWRNLTRLLRGELRLQLMEAGKTIMHPPVDREEAAVVEQVPPPAQAFLPVTEQPVGVEPAPRPAAPAEQAPARLIPIPLTTAYSPERPATSLAIYCLGMFKVFLNNQFVTDWTGQKGASVFKYLLANRERPVAKDILMDLFWPGADPEVARRNLHQAIYALRQTLRRTLPELQLILFENDCYRINPELEAWLDFEEFERYVQNGRSHAQAGRSAEAMEAFAMAEELYQGDFLEEELYEDWLQPRREYLRTVYLETASWISEYYIQNRLIAPAIILCQKVLAKDHCNEQAYRGLMQCHLIQGQRQLAIREYYLCVQTLKDELNLPPSEETQALYRQITSRS